MLLHLHSWHFWAILSSRATKRPETQISFEAGLNDSTIRFLISSSSIYFIWCLCVLLREWVCVCVCWGKLRTNKFPLAQVTRKARSPSKPTKKNVNISVLRVEILTVSVDLCRFFAQWCESICFFASELQETVLSFHHVFVTGFHDISSCEQYIFPCQTLKKKAQT